MTETRIPSDSEIQQLVQQKSYQKRYENAQIEIKSGLYHSDGIRACLDLLKHNDLAMMLKARVNLTVAEYGVIEEMPNKMRYLDTCFAVIDEMEKSQLPNDKTLMELRLHAEGVKKEVDADVDKDRKEMANAKEKKAKKDKMGEEEYMKEMEQEYTKEQEEEKKRSDDRVKDLEPQKSLRSFFRRR